MDKKIKKELWDRFSKTSENVNKNLVAAYKAKHLSLSEKDLILILNLVTSSVKESFDNVSNNLIKKIAKMHSDEQARN